MTETLEDKYIYMCKKYEKLAVDYEALYKLSDKLSQRLNQIARKNKVSWNRIGSR